MRGKATKEKIRRAIVIIYILMLSAASVFVALAGLCASLHPPTSPFHHPPPFPFLAHCFAQNPLRETTEKLWCVGRGGGKAAHGPLSVDCSHRNTRWKKGRSRQRRSSNSCLLAESSSDSSDCEICRFLFTLSFFFCLFVFK